MSISFKRIRAIFLKDYKEFSRNYAVSTMMIFPILMAFLYRSDDPTEIGTFVFTLNFSFAMLTSFVQAALIAEEKERNTLRSLMMTPATTMDVLIGKSSLVFAITAVILAVVTYLYGYEPASMWAFVAALFISMILYTAIGTICGLFSKTLLEASLSVFPVLILFTAAPFGVLLVDDFSFFKVLEYMPSSQLVNLLEIFNTGFSTGDVLKPLLIMLVWAVVLTIVSIVMYQKRLMDE
jgi:ABC-2 type transport system permease protein